VCVCVCVCVVFTFTRRPLVDTSRHVTSNRFQSRHQNTVISPLSLCAISAMLHDTRAPSSLPPALCRPVHRSSSTDTRQIPIHRGYSPQIPSLRPCPPVVHAAYSLNPITAVRSLSLNSRHSLSLSLFNCSFYAVCRHCPSIT